MVISLVALRQSWVWQRIQSVAQGIVIWCHFGQKSLVKAAVFEASKIGGKIAYSIRDDGKAVLYAVI